MACSFFGMLITSSASNVTVIAPRWAKCYVTFISSVLLTIYFNNECVWDSTTSRMMTPCFQLFSIGLRHTHTLSPGSKFTFLVLDESSEGCHSATSSGLLLCITGKFDANLQPKNNSAGLSLDFIYSRGVVLCTSNPNRKLISTLSVYFFNNTNCSFSMSISPWVPR